jgi:rhodanese-related sulfurtransferase
MAIHEITVDELAERLASGSRLVDVREPREFDAGHVPGAVHVPYATVPDNVERFRGEGPTFVICRSGGRSLRVCEFLSDRGVEAVNVAGGTLAWQLSGRTVETVEIADS